MGTLIDFMVRKTQRDINCLHKEAERYDRLGCPGSVAGCVEEARILQHYVWGVDSDYADEDPPREKYKLRG